MNLIFSGIVLIIFFSIFAIGGLDSDTIFSKVYAQNDRDKVITASTQSELQPSITQIINKKVKESNDPNSHTVLVFSNYAWSLWVKDQDFNGYNIENYDKFFYEFSVTCNSSDAHSVWYSLYRHVASGDAFAQIVVIQDGNILENSTEKGAVGKSRTYGVDCYEPPYNPGSEPTPVDLSLVYNTHQEMVPVIDSEIDKAVNGPAPVDSGKILVFSNIDWSGTLVDQNDGTMVRSIASQGPITELTFPCNISNPGIQSFLLTIHGSSKDPNLKPFVQTFVRTDQNIFYDEPAFGERINFLKAYQCGGCLIATATFGSSLAPQVQMLREIRDNQLMQTESGNSFMTFFNTYYYTFSPTIASWERQNELFKEFMKISLTPLISTLSVLRFLDVDSESEVLFFGISLMVLNLSMYIIAPIVFSVKVIPKSVKFIKKQNIMKNFKILSS